MPVIPRHLEPGDTIGLIAPASPPPDPKTVDVSIAALERMGFAVKVGRNARKRHGFLAGADRERAADVMQMFGDPKVNGIVCIRGGYGAGRILPLLDYAAIRRHPKVFIGFSDITSLHCALLKKSNLVTFHGPMTGSHLARKETPQFTLDSFVRTLMHPAAPGSVCQGYDRKTVHIVRRGKVSGQIIGGNLSVLMTTLATPYQLSFRGKILVIEDVDEKPYQMDRMLTHLMNAGLLQQVAGVATGLCDNCLDPRAKGAREFRQTVDHVLAERLGALGVPVVTGLPFGHVPYNATLPIGGYAALDANRGDLIISRSVVT